LMNNLRGVKNLFNTNLLFTNLVKVSRKAK